MNHAFCIHPQFVSFLFSMKNKMKDIDRYPCLDPNFLGNFQCFPKTSAVILTGSPYCFGVLKFNVKFILWFFFLYLLR